MSRLTFHTVAETLRAVRILEAYGIEAVAWDLYSIMVPQDKVEAIKALIA